MLARDIVVVGASAGGVEAVLELARHFPPGLQSSVFIVVHFPADAKSHLPRLISRVTQMPVDHVRGDTAILPGRIYVAPPGHHLILKPGFMRLTETPLENGVRPAVDTLFRSAAEAYGSRVIGVVLSGCSDDGMAGLIEIKKHGGVTVAQTPAEALFDEMPSNAIRRALAQHVLPLREIAALIQQLSKSPEPVGTHYVGQ